MSLPNSWLFVMYMKTPCSIQERESSVAFAKVWNRNVCSDALRESLMHAHLCKYDTWDRNLPGRHKNCKSGKLPQGFICIKLKISIIIWAATQFSFSFFFRQNIQTTRCDRSTDLALALAHQFLFGDYNQLLSASIPPIYGELMQIK